MKKVVYSVVVATAVLASPVVGQALPAAASSTAGMTSYSVTDTGAAQASFSWINSQTAAKTAAPSLEKDRLQMNSLYDGGWGGGIGSGGGFSKAMA
ncbi:hypothetical protein DNH61_18985 [Paenibacillus sambharensis]|uniref:Uncharacterized protein n=1 Tax=Paenibacillus sambharensis TaxID=1803190 RepID=A0A2W1L379_9BACL|nr:hypothetical protein [Paenibacillus sambharensis]PZD94478.1 hypothetical protein DNH61_18985 [Paenibacillus sambharensis]